MAYATGEQVLAYHMNMLYDAKVLSVEEGERDGKTVPLFKTHYQGWKSRYDELVDESRLMKFNEANKEIQAEMRLELRRKKEKEKAKEREKKAGATGAKVKKKPGRKPGRPKRKESVSGPSTECDVVLPVVLRERLVNDQHYIVQSKSVQPRCGLVAVACACFTSIHKP